MLENRQAHAIGTSQVTKERQKQNAFARWPLPPVDGKEQLTDKQEMENGSPADLRAVKEALKHRYTRIRRAKQILRFLPRKTNIHRYPILKYFANAARKRPALWSFRTKHVSPAIYAGCIIAFLPIYGIQIPLAFLAAFIFRANLLVATALQLITNPITFVFIYTFNYMAGKTMIDFWNLGKFDSLIGAKAYPLVLGGIIVGLVCALILDLSYRIGSKQKKTPSPTNENT